MVVFSVIFLQKIKNKKFLNILNHKIMKIMKYTRMIIKNIQFLKYFRIINFNFNYFLVNQNMLFSIESII